MAELEKGARVGEWVVEETLGRGAFGITYRAHRLTAEGKTQIAALKEFYPSEYVVRRETGEIAVTSTSRKEFDIERKMFLAEADAIASVSHPNVAAVYGILEANGTSYIEMELIDGPTLTKVVMPKGGGRDPMTVDQLAGVLRQLLEALSDIHAKKPPLLHRDIKPGNIVFRTEDKSPVLIDFGAARQMIAGRSQKLTAILTKGFAPYEQYTLDEEEWEEMETGGPVADDMPRQGPPTDLYALAATCYFALTGYAPRDSLQRKIATDTIRPLVRRVDGNRRILASIDKALSVEPEDRFATAGDWLAELDRAERSPEYVRQSEAQDVSDQDDPETVLMQRERPNPAAMEDQPVVTDNTATGDQNGFYYHVLRVLTGLIVAFGHFLIGAGAFGTVAEFFGPNSERRMEAGWDVFAGVAFALGAGTIWCVSVFLAILPSFILLSGMIERVASMKRYSVLFVISLVLGCAILFGGFVLFFGFTFSYKSLSDGELWAIAVQEARGAGYVLTRIIAAVTAIFYAWGFLEVVRSVQVYWSRSYRQRLLSKRWPRWFATGAR